ncbi:hypothetical protein GWK08_14765 [Leptobacterium flavescens]|uniref:Uncharacterized protein n=1 Tax=Leptobacterium flavescens TaxID=472055 RepID=A0A6P0UWA9_9FLAO|nr:hypothetical protein [Leptobacterium flavescens]NER14716.1 hypothetical protein [Leptobacterium flavescens]
MAAHKLSDDWLFMNFPKYHIRFWASQLKYGFFMRAANNHSKDGDSFQIWLEYKDVKELVEILDHLTIKLEKIPEEAPKKSFWSKKPQIEQLRIPDLPEYEQPQHTKIDRIPCFCWIEDGRVCLSVSGSKDGNFYKVSEVDFRNCIKLEKILEEANLTSYVSEAYCEIGNCISRKTYPELYEPPKYN